MSYEEKCHNLNMALAELLRTANGSDEIADMASAFEAFSQEELAKARRDLSLAGGFIDTIRETIEWHIAFPIAEREVPSPE